MVGFIRRNFILDAEIKEAPKGAKYSNEDCFCVEFDIVPTYKLKKGQYEAKIFIGDIWRTADFDKFIIDVEY